MVTAIHKGNVLIEGDGLFLEETRKTSKKYEGISSRKNLLIPQQCNWSLLRKALT